MALPLLFTWATMASLLVLFKLYHPILSHSAGLHVIIIMGFFVLMSLVITLSCVVVLKLLFDIEADASQPNLSAAVTSTIALVPTILPLWLLWALLWAILLCLSLIRSNSNDQQAASSGNSGGDVSISSMLLSAGTKVIRMAILLCLPAIAWENYTVRLSMRRSYDVIRANTSGFFTNFVTSYIFLAAFFAVLAAHKLLGQNADQYFEVIIWTEMLLILMLFSLSIYVELIMMRCNTCCTSNGNTQ